MNQIKMGTIIKSYSRGLKEQFMQVPVGNTISERYTYDGVGNRLSSLEYPEWEYNSANQLLRFDNHYYQYDDNGSMIEMNEPDGYKHLTYSVDDRPVNFHYIDGNFNGIVMI